MSHGIFLDDDPKAIAEADLAEARQRVGELTDHQVAVGAIEFQGLAQALVAKAIAFGQTRTSFLASLASSWDSAFPAYKTLMRAQQMAAEQRAAEAAAATAPDGGALCEHGNYPSRCVQCGAPPLDASVVAPAGGTPVIETPDKAPDKP